MKKLKLLLLAGMLAGIGSAFATVYCPNPVVSQCEKQCGYSWMTWFKPSVKKCVNSCEYANNCEPGVARQTSYLAVDGGKFAAYPAPAPAQAPLTSSKPMVPAN
jgi:hypothetical protein